ncbi:MAG: hypothetical protein ABJB11_19070 [Ferruginibacter sp.]
MKILFRARLLMTLLIIMGSAGSVMAQYYYKDIVSNKQAMAERAELKAQKIRTIKVHSFEGDKEPSSGFFCEKKLSKDFRKVETYTRSNISGKSLFTALYNDKEQLIQSSDSSDLSVSTSSYKYDSKGNVSTISSYSHSSDDDFSTRLTELHQYFYDEQNRPEKMLRIMNGKDSSFTIFSLDQRGNVIDENDMGKNGKHYYYYFNDKNKMTDIVKFNVVKNKLLPDFVFEYNNAGQVTQMIAVEEGVNNNYYTWKYVYNDGLRIIEKCFSKENVLLGYFEYEYD